MAVVVSSNIVRMAFYLVLSLAATSGLFFLAGADFVGAMQLMIYVGGTLVLLIFGVMLTAKGPFITMKTGGRRVDAGGAGRRLAVGRAAGGGLERARLADQRPSAAATRRQVTATPLGMGAVGRPRRSSSTRATPTHARGMSGYLLPFEIISVHLLVVLVGAAYLARPKKRAAPAQRTWFDRSV